MALSQAQLYVLYYIGQKPMARLAHLPHDAPNGAYVVNLAGLVRRGYLERRPDPAYGYRFHLTPDGRGAISDYTPPPTP